MTTNSIEDLKSRILFEDNHLIIVNKKVGEITQGDKTGDLPLPDLVKAYIKENENKPGNVFLGVIHRLDRPTSGIVVFAKTSKALSRMTVAFKNREVQKTYWAITKNTPEPENGKLVHFLKKNPQKNKSKVFENEVTGSKKAILHYSTQKKSDRYNLLEISLETGRHHQIRAQLSYLGCPIVGDLKYGYQRSNKDGGICLHSRKISFIHPTKKENITVSAHTPKGSFWQIFEQ